MEPYNTRYRRERWETPDGRSILGKLPAGVTSHFGPSPKAFLVVPLIGAFLLDILNAFVIQTYIGLLP